MYYIYDEFGQLMRMVRRREEAEHICKIYTDWTYEHVKPVKKEFNFNNFDDAPF